MESKKVAFSCEPIKETKIVGVTITMSTEEAKQLRGLAGDQAGPLNGIWQKLWDGLAHV